MSNLQHTNTHLPSSLGAAILSKIGTGILEPFESLARAGAASCEIEHLYNMSDDQLTDHGLSRDDIPRHIVTKYFRVR